MKTDQQMLEKLNLKKHIEGEILKNVLIKDKFLSALQKTETSELPPNHSVLFFELVSQGKTLENADFALFLQYIKEGKIQTKIQVQEVIEFLKQNPEFSYENIETLNKAIGVGVTYTDEEINQKIDEVI